MGIQGRVSVECEFIGSDSKELEKKSKALHSFFLKKRREVRKQAGESADPSSDGRLVGLAWLLNGELVDGPSGQSVYCDDCAGPDSEFLPFLEELEKRFPEVSYVVKSGSWQSTVDSPLEGNVLFRKALPSTAFLGQILSIERVADRFQADAQHQDPLRRREGVLQGHRRAQRGACRRDLVHP